jgi:uroporphyrinogen decarboxylase
MKEADRVPCIPLLCGASRRVYGCGYEEWSRDGEIAAKSLLQAQSLLGFDAFVTEIDLNVEAADLGQQISFPDDDQSYPNQKNALIKTAEDYLTKVQPVDPAKGERMSEHARTCDILMNESGDTVPVFAFVYSPLGVLSIMRGPELLFSDCMQYQEEIQSALSTITDVLEAYIRHLAKTGIHAVWMETLFGNSKHMGKKLWLDTDGPHLRRLARVIRECRLMVIAHSSGVGFYMDAHLETMNPDAMSCAWVPDGCKDWVEAKARWGNRTCLMGHVHPIEYLYLGTEADVMEECKREMEELADGAGYILAPKWEYPHNASLLNARAMMDAVELYGRYE